MKVFVDDTVRLNLNTGKDVSTFTTFKIKYKKPDGTQGRWTAALCGTSNLCIYADVQFDVSGVWQVQAFVQKVGEYYHGFWADVRVYDALAPLSTVPPTTAPPTTTAPTT
jgi:hypothetical protein